VTATLLIEKLTQPLFSEQAFYGSSKRNSLNSTIEEGKLLYSKLVRYK
jgi:hypothetical protein